MFITPIKVNECFLQTPKFGNNNKPSRFISGGLFSGEFERAIGAIGMILNKTEFGGQYYLDCLSFSTSMPSAAGKILFVDLRLFEYSFYLNLFPPGHASSSSHTGTQSPFSGRPGGNTKSKTVLAFSDVGEYISLYSYLLLNRSDVHLFASNLILVPIYDARDLVTDDFNEVLTSLTTLDQLDHDVPEGSCVVVGHTITTFIKKSNEQLNVSFNIHWVAVLGTAV